MLMIMYNDHLSVEFSISIANGNFIVVLDKGHTCQYSKYFNTFPSLKQNIINKERYHAVVDLVTHRYMQPVALGQK